VEDGGGCGGGLGGARGSGGGARRGGGHATHQREQGAENGELDLQDDLLRVSKYENHTLIYHGQHTTWS